MRSKFDTALIMLLALFGHNLRAETIPVHHTEGIVRGFLVLKSLDGNTLAGGDFFQDSSNGKVTSHVLFHFKDGSIHDETTVFTQNRTFQLHSYHLIQKGPIFAQQMDFSFDTASGKVKVQYQDKDAKPVTIEDKMEMPEDLANGIVGILLKNIKTDTPLTEVSLLVTTPKPRLIKLKLTPGGEIAFSAGGISQKAQRFNVRVDIGGFIGFVAKVIGKQPPDTSIWMVGGNVPGILGSEGQLFADGPIWRIEQAAPVLSKPEKH